MAKHHSGQTPQTSDEFFDDCPICHLMKRAVEEGREPSRQELRKAFKEAKKQGAIVGGLALPDSDTVN